MKSRTFWAKFWSDIYVFELPAKEKLLFNYLITNERTNMSGIYQLHDKYILFETDLTADELQSAKVKFQNDGRFYFYQGWVYVANNHKHNQFSSSPSVINAFIHEFNLIPRAVKNYFLGDLRLRYIFPFKKDVVAFKKRESDTDYEWDLDWDYDKVGGGMGGGMGTHRVSSYVDPDEIDKGIQLQDALKGVINCSIGLLIVFIFGALSHKVVLAETIYIKHTITISDTQSPVTKVSDHDKKSTGQAKRSLGAKAKAGEVYKKPTAVHKAVQPSPAKADIKLTEQKLAVAHMIRDAFPDNAKTMIAIAMAESGLRCEAVNAMDSNGVQSVGLFQINDGRWFSEQDIANLTTCSHNIERAKQKYATQGIGAWGSFHNKSYLKYLSISDQI